jgi:hypothetical protein
LLCFFQSFISVSFSPAFFFLSFLLLIHFSFPFYCLPSCVRHRDSSGSMTCLSNYSEHTCPSASVQHSLPKLNSAH